MIYTLIKNGKNMAISANIHKNINTIYIPNIEISLKINYFLNSLSNNN